MYSDVASYGSKLNSVPPISKSALIHIYLKVFDCQKQNVLFECVFDQSRGRRKLYCHFQALDGEPLFEIQMCVFTLLSTRSKIKLPCKNINKLGFRDRVASNGSPQVLIFSWGMMNNA